MSLLSRLSARAWVLIPLCACGFLLWTNHERARRVDDVTNTDHDDAVVDAASPTGYAGGQRWLIVPEHNNRSYRWIAETQQMLARGEWRVRHVDDENAPYGCDVSSASPYRWWLAALAWGDHAISGRPLGLSVERAALYSDPLLHLALLLGASLFVAYQCGPLPGALLAVGLALIFPLAGGFLPGVPDDRGLARACALWSVLPLVVLACRRPRATTASGPSPPSAARWFFAAGVAGGIGLWIDAAVETPVLVGIALGGILAMSLARSGRNPDPREVPGDLPWRSWALGGAATCLAAYLVEFFPAHLEMRLEVNHPLFGIAWWGVGEWLAQIDAGRRAGKFPRQLRPVIMLALATVAVAALPVALQWTRTRSLLSGDLSTSRLTYLPNGVVAQSFPVWVARDGLTPAVVATCLPLLVFVPAFGLLLRRRTGAVQRRAIALALGPVGVALVLAGRQLAWWGACDALLLVLVVATAGFPAGVPDRRRWLAWGGACLFLLPGGFRLLPPPTQGNVEFTRLEVEALIERSLAHWIADRAPPGGAVVLLPPDRTASWCFHGGMRGLGTSDWENRDGLEATVRIITATTADEAQALINQRGITHLVLPSWDKDLDEFARWTLRNPEDAFLMALHHWALPPWLRPMPYRLPANVGFDGQSVVILRVTDDTNRIAALSRLAEYFIESQQIENAASVGQALQRYPTDLSALAALAQVEKAQGDGPAFARTLDTLLASVASGADRALAWDRRVSLAVTLAQGERLDLAREQVRRCLEKVDEARLRSLTTGALFRLQVMEKSFGLGLPDPKLQALAVHLLPAELRSRL